MPVTFAYDNDGVLMSAGALAITPDPANGRPVATSVGTVTESIAYEQTGERKQSTVNVSDLERLTLATVTRDDLGRAITESETFNGVTNTTTYGYDVAGRLETVHRNGTLGATYAYDANGNRTSVTKNGQTTTPTYDGQDRLLTYGGTMYTYTANGELRTKTEASGTTTYTYDAFGSLRTVTLSDGRTIEYVIDGQNRRVGKKINGVLQQGWLYSDKLGIAAELDGTGQVVSRFIYGTRSNVPDLMIKSGITYRIMSDQRGSPVLTIDTSSGETIQYRTYDEFGNITADTNPNLHPFGFAGGLYDSDTGLTRFGARDYDPQTGRWTAKDPILFEGGDTNLYGHAFNDPINFYDPTGLVTVPFVGQVAAGEEAGTRAVESYADTLTDPEAEWYEKAGAAVGGGFAALWTPETSDDTATVLGCAIGGSGAWRGVQRGGWLNANRYLRMGFGKGKGARKVFRISGDMIQKIKKSGHIDIWKGGPFGK